MRNSYIITVLLASLIFKDLVYILMQFPIVGLQSFLSLVSLLSFRYINQNSVFQSALVVY